jgi:hypothetical protein
LIEAIARTGAREPGHHNNPDESGGNDGQRATAAAPDLSRLHAFRC